MRLRTAAERAGIERFPAETAVAGLNEEAAVLALAALRTAARILKTGAGFRRTAPMEAGRWSGTAQIYRGRAGLRETSEQSFGGGVRRWG